MVLVGFRGDGFGRVSRRRLSLLAGTLKKSGSSITQRDDDGGGGRAYRGDGLRTPFPLPRRGVEDAAVTAEEDDEGEGLRVTPCRCWATPSAIARHERRSASTT